MSAVEQRDAADKRCGLARFARTSLGRRLQLIPVLGRPYERISDRMPKRPLKLKSRIPEYTGPRNTWREAIHRAVTEVQRTTPVKYGPSDKLEVALRLYFTNRRSAEIHDVDNRLKDCLDALQGRVGGTKTKAVRALEPIIPNDRQIWRVVVEKSSCPEAGAGPWAPHDPQTEAALSAGLPNNALHLTGGARKLVAVRR